MITTLGKGKGSLVEEVTFAAEKPVKRSFVESSASHPPPLSSSCPPPGSLIERLPDVQRVCHCSASPPPYRVPPQYLGGTKSEVEKLEQRLKDTTLKEKDVVK
ncbi:hypothetical protein TSUD_04880 [Trifolium subterraneum]|uniref:Uncharacterized protein n=1 Tax=Trifolium subterraneum TaxID=3900 RepID=A0A2Z6N7V3_TRISU|nr:hypothetical protein TSUD_04880 [Trifolium subterraneum]